MQHKVSRIGSLQFLSNTPWTQRSQGQMRPELFSSLRTVFFLDLPLDLDQPTAGLLLRNLGDPQVAILVASSWSDQGRCASTLQRSRCVLACMLPGRPGLGSSMKSGSFLSCMHACRPIGGSPSVVSSILMTGYRLRNFV